MALYRFVLINWLIIIRTATITTIYQLGMLPPGSWRGPGDAIISRLSSASCNGVLCSSASCSRLRLSPTGLVSNAQGHRLSARRRRPCQTTAFCRHSKEHSLSEGHAAVLETGPLSLQDHKSGTVCRPISDYVGSVIRPVQAVTEDIFIGTVRPRRSVNCF